MMTPTPAANALPAPVPEIQPETADFWAATANDVLLLQRCADCDTTIWYPRFLCPSCHSTNLVNFESSGQGQIYSLTLTSRGILEYKECGPYVLAFVELDEGPKMLTNVVSADLASLAIGQRVEVFFADTGAGTALPRFQPVEGPAQ